MTPQQNSSQMQSESHEENPFAQVMENEHANIQQESEKADGEGSMRPNIMVIAVLTICLDKTM